MLREAVGVLPYENAQGTSEQRCTRQFGRQREAVDVVPYENAQGLCEQGCKRQFRRQREAVGVLPYGPAPGMVRTRAHAGRVLVQSFAEPFNLLFIRKRQFSALQVLGDS